MKLPQLHSNSRFFQTIATANSSKKTIYAGIGLAQINFKAGWDDDDNNDVGNYSKAKITEILEAYSDDMAAMVNGASKCKLTVTKGCHQKNDPHITANGVGSTNKCDNVYAGSRSIHIPCS
jgi:hypothetical protein